MKKTISLLLTFILIITPLLSLNTANAATKATNKNVTWNIQDNILTLSGKGTLKNYNNPLLKKSENVTKIIVNGFEYTESGLSIFEDLEKLHSVTFSGSLKYLSHDEFEWCDNLKSVYFKNKDTEILPRRETIPDQCVIYAPAGGNVQKYAKNFGKSFVDTTTKKRTDYKLTNNMIVKLLPTNLEPAEPVSCFCIVTDMQGRLDGFAPNIVYEKNKNSANYKEIKQFVEDLVKDKTTNYEKAIAITNWVYKNMKYRAGGISGNTIESVYWIFCYRSGNCMCYTQITNYFLYLAGIPSATITTQGHEYSAALIDGKWYKIDSTVNEINENFDSEQPYLQISALHFATTDNTVLTICGLNGILFSGCQCCPDDPTPKTIKIPSYVKGVLTDTFTDLEGNCVKWIKGTKGSYAEKWCRNNGYPCVVSNKNNMFTAGQKHHYSDKKASKQVTAKKDGEVHYKCKDCGGVVKVPVKAPEIKKIKIYKERDINNKRFYMLEIYKTVVENTSGFQVQYSKNKNFKNAKTEGTKYFNDETFSISKKLNKGKYYVRIRSYKIVNGKKIYSRWSKAKTITIKE